MKVHPIDYCDGGLIGYVRTTRAAIERVFGPGESNAGDKVYHSWSFRFEDGTEGSIYDWKRYSDEPVPVNESFTWNVGGDEAKSLHTRNLISSALGAQVSRA